MNRCELCNERTDSIGLCYNPRCRNYRGSQLAPEPAIGAFMHEQAERIDRAETNVRHWREQCGKLQAQLKIADDKVARIDRDAKQFSEEVASAFRKHGLVVGPTALDRTMAELEKLRGYYQEIVKELGDDLALKRIKELRVDLQAAKDRDAYRENLIEELRTERQELRDHLEETRKARDVAETAFNRWLASEEKTAPLLKRDDVLKAVDTLLTTLQVKP